MQSIENFGAIRSIWFPEGWTVLPHENRLAGESVHKCIPIEQPEFSVSIHLFSLALCGTERESLIKMFGFEKESFSQKEISTLGMVAAEFGQSALFDLASARNGFLRDRRCLRIEGFEKKKGRNPAQAFMWSVDKNLSVCQSLVTRGKKDYWHRYLPEVAFATGTISWVEFPSVNLDE